MMRQESSRRRFFGWRKVKRWLLGCVLFSLLLLWLGWSSSPWEHPAQLLVFLGKFHPLVLHLPIGMLVVVLLLEWRAIGKWDKSHVLMPLVMTVISAVVAVFFGYVLMRSGGYSSSVMTLHLWSGVGFAIALIWTLFFKVRYNVIGKGQKTYGVLLALSVLLMVLTGHYGGVMTHGDPLDAAPWNQKTFQKKKAGGVSSSSVEDRLIYEDVVVPILKAKCYKCHSEQKKKGHLRMDSYALMLEGGDEGECLVPGDLSKSLMIERMRLPSDDEDVMPPKDKPSLSESEIRVIEWWVQVGAPQNKKISEMQVPPAVLESMRQL